MTPTTNMLTMWNNSTATPIGECTLILGNPTIYQTYNVPFVVVEQEDFTHTFLWNSCCTRNADHYYRQRKRSVPGVATNWTLCHKLICVWSVSGVATNWPLCHKLICVWSVPGVATNWTLCHKLICVWQRTRLFTGRSLRLS